MGLWQSKQESDEDLLNTTPDHCKQFSRLSTLPDPRSPADQRTPLPVPMDDPRSPSGDVERTPIITSSIPAHTSCQSPLGIPGQLHPELDDPRSPSVTVHRSPVCLTTAESDSSPASSRISDNSAFVGSPIPMLVESVEIPPEKKSYEVNQAFEDSPLSKASRDSELSLTSRDSDSCASDAESNIVPEDAPSVENGAFVAESLPVIIGTCLTSEAAASDSMIPVPAKTGLARPKRRQTRQKKIQQPMLKSVLFTAFTDDDDSENSEAAATTSNNDAARKKHIPVAPKKFKGENPSKGLQLRNRNISSSSNEESGKQRIVRPRAALVGKENVQA